MPAIPQEPQPTQTATPPAAPSSTGRLVVVFSTKGGVGKTVISINLAVALSQRLGRPVGLIDLDLTGPGDTAKMLRLNPEHTFVDLVSYLDQQKSDRNPSLDGVLAVHDAGIHVVQCVGDPRDRNRLTPQALQWLFQAMRL